MARGRRLRAEGMAADEGAVGGLRGEQGVRSIRIGPAGPDRGRLEPRFVTVASAARGSRLPGSASRIDLATRDVVADIDRVQPQVMVEAVSRLWVSSVDTDAVQRIDPRQIKPSPRYALEALPDGLLRSMARSGWRRTSGRSFQRIDAEPGRSRHLGGVRPRSDRREPAGGGGWRGVLVSRCSSGGSVEAPRCYPRTFGSC